MERGGFTKAEKSNRDFTTVMVISKDGTVLAFCCIAGWSISEGVT